MVFAHVIEPFHEGRPFSPLDINHNKQQVADMSLQSQMLGIINVISSLAEYTNEVFSSLLQESAGISSRISAISQRCATLSHKVEETEKSMNNISVEAKTTNVRVEFHSTPVEYAPLFTPETAPPSVRYQYQKCSPPPNLSLLDQFAPGQSCMKAYSDPGFFLTQYLESQARLREEVRQYRAAKRAERETKRKLEEAEEERERNTNENNNNWNVLLEVRRPVRMPTYKYDVHTGQKEFVSSPQHRKRQPPQAQTGPTPVLPNRDLPRPEPPKRDPMLPNQAIPNEISDKRWETQPKRAAVDRPMRQDNRPDPLKFGMPASGIPTPGMPTPGLPTPGMPTPVMPAPEMLAPGMLAPGMLAPGMPAPGIPAPGMPSSGLPAATPELPFLGLPPRIPDCETPAPLELPFSGVPSDCRKSILHEPVPHALPAGQKWDNNDSNTVNNNVPPPLPPRPVVTSAPVAKVVGPVRSNLLLQIEEGITLRPTPTLQEPKKTYHPFFNFPVPLPVLSGDDETDDDDDWDTWSDGDELFSVLHRRA